MHPSAQSEIQAGQRFAFGRNWQSFLNTLDEARIATAEQSLRDLLQVSDLQSQTFLDVGCGSGLFSLAARRLGAQVRSFDFDPQSVACTEELRQRFDFDDPNWTIEQGSALDASYLKSLRQFNVVYAWGSLHHTGDMWQAIDLIAQRVAPGGYLVLAIYNDQGWQSRIWGGVKRTYCSGTMGKSAMTAAFYPYFFCRTVGVSLIRRQNEFAKYRERRGMSLRHDWADWLGGYPFEVAKPDDVIGFLKERGYECEILTPTRRLGCNEFVFRLVRK